MKQRTLFCLASVLALLLAACGQGGKKKPQPVAAINYAQVQSPVFNADSAYRFVADQLAFGFRTPGSVGQQRCADYLVRKMRQWCDTVVVQDFPATLWDGTQVRGKNIVASLEAREGSNPANRRVVLAAHWDSRLWADHDALEANHRKPLMGANDGASGVAVLMEMARVMQQQRPSVAVDFIFFDVEDQGCPEWSDSYQDDSWCKGSQYWSSNPHTPYYSAVYGVLLDMVGTERPRFTKEQVSMKYAGSIMNKMWACAAALGYENIFVNAQTDPILDDHMYVNLRTSIPMLDIVQNNVDCSFFEHWHTLGDDLSHVSAQTMGIVAEVVLKTLYADYE